MRPPTLLAACALFALALGTPAAIAEPAVRTAAAETPISFDQYRDFRLQIIERRRESLTLRLAAPNLADKDKASLERQKAYYDRWAGMAPELRDRLFRERFEEIDSDHDGSIDTRERAAWRTRQQAYYRELALDRARGAGGQR